MKRLGARIFGRLVIGVGFLAMGAVVAAAVAWAGVIWFPPHRQPTIVFMPDEAPSEVLRHVPPDWMSSEGRRELLVHSATGRVSTVRWVELHLSAPDHKDELVSVSAGWPVRCFDAVETTYPWQFEVLLQRANVWLTSRIPTPQWRYGVAIPDWLDPSLEDPLGLGWAARIIPLRPIPLGLAINAAVFAGALALVATAVRAGRRGFRSYMGLCPACAYPAGASSVCSECGGPVRPDVGAAMSGGA